MSQPSFTQHTFRLRNDNGAEGSGGATWKQIQGADDTINADENFRVRFLIDEGNSKAWSGVTFRLFYSLQGGTYTQMTGTTPIQWATSSGFTDGDDSTSQLTGGSGGSFVTDNNGMDDSDGSVSNSGAIDDYFECEFCVTMDSGQVSDTNTIELRVYDNTTAIASYTDHPLITVSISGGTLFQQSAAGATTPSGTLKSKGKKLLAGTTTSAGNLIKKTITSLAGAMTSSGDVVKKILTALDGAMTSSGILTYKSRFTKALAGLMSPSGDVFTKVGKHLSGAMISGGNVVKKVFLSLTGLMTSDGVVNAVKLGVIYYESIAGSMTSSGDITRNIFKIFLGSMTSGGELVKKTITSLAGSMSSVGDVLRLPKKLLVGAMVSSGNITRKIFKLLSGLMSSSGYLNATKVGITVYYKSVAGAMTSSGLLLKKVSIILSGILTSTGSVVKKTLKYFTGVTASSGEILRKVKKSLSGVMTNLGSIRKKTSRVLSGVLTSIGAVIGSWLPSVVLDETIVIIGETNVDVVGITDDSVYDVTIGSEGHT